MRISYKSAVVAAALSAALILAASCGVMEREDAQAQAYENNTREITVFDRDGNVAKVLGPRAIYSQPILSPDGTRIAVVQADPEAESTDLWVMDIDSGRATRITTSASGEGVRAPVWSPDGSQIAYVAMRNTRRGIHRKSSNGKGTEELLYDLHGERITLTDWSLDGRFLNYYSLQPEGSAIFALPLAGERMPIEVVRSESQLVAPRLSPDSRYVAYRSDRSGRNEIWVRSFELSGDGEAEPSQVSTEGGVGMVWWRRDSRELYYLAPDRGVMAVDVNTTGSFKSGEPRLLFRLPDSVPVTGTPGAFGSVSRDGQRVVFIVPPAPAPQISDSGEVVTQPVIPEEVAPVEAIAPEAADGHVGVGFLRKPPGDGPFPAVVLIHGGLTRVPTGAVRNYALSGYPSRFLEAGYAVAVITYRSRNVDPQTTVSLADSVAAVEYMKSLADVDPDSVVIDGCSGGGDLVLDVAGQTKVAATVSEEPATVLFTGMFNKDTVKAGAVFTVPDALPLLEDPQSFYTEEIQEITREKVSRIEGPVFIVQGDQLFAGRDHLRIQNEILIPEMISAGIELQRMVYPGQQHCFAFQDQTPAAREAFEDIDAFFRQRMPIPPKPVDSALVQHVPLRMN